MKVFFLSDLRSNRLDYILDFLSERLGIDFMVVNKLPQNFRDIYIIYYGVNPVENCNLFIPKTDLLEVNVTTASPEFSISRPAEPIFFTKPWGAEAKIDFLGLAFFYLSRMEEYVTEGADKLGRFCSEQSFSHQNECLYSAPVDRWCREFGDILHKFNPGITVKSAQREVLPSCDLDIPYAFEGKSRLKLLAGSLKSLAKGKTGETVCRLKYLYKKGKDPYDSLPQLIDSAALFNKKLKCFVLYPHNSNDYRDRTGLEVRKLPDTYFNKFSGEVEWGLHPSVSSGSDSKIYKKELQLLSLVTGSEITASRQHFLRLKLPQTYRALISAGIREDYSMGYHDSPGFRAGTSRPFFWYDLEREQTTGLKVHPLLLMDASLRHHLNLSSDMAIKKIDLLLEECMETNGIFSYLWHNSSLSQVDGWDAYAPVFSYLVKSCAEYLKN